jgi:hypothetical protein
LIKLVDLNPSWVGSGGSDVRDKDGKPVPRREGVGIIFDCPCGKHGEDRSEAREYDFRVFVHLKQPLDGGPPIVSEPRPTWDREGDTFESLTLRPSIQRVDGCRWHGFVTNGEVTTC